MTPSFRCIMSTTLLLLCVAGQASAQYMKITTDNPADATRLRSSGTTILTITLDTNHDRDGSLQACNSHTVAFGCGSASTGQALNLFSYTITLAAVGGTVSWGTFTAADPSYTPLGSDLASDTQTEFTRATSPPTVTPAGLVTLGSIPVTLVSGAPEIRIAHGPQNINPSGFGTGFGTFCDGFIYLNTYLLGDPAFVCASGDWFDVDGAAAPSQGTGAGCPTSAPGGIYRGLVGVPLMFDGTGSFDPDGDPLAYAWDFDARDGIQVDATGATPSHTFPAFRQYTVTLTVTDNASPPCSDSETTFADILDVCETTIFNGYEPIRLDTGRSWFAYLQPTSACYDNTEVILSSLIMYLPTGAPPIHAETRKTAINGDNNGDGIDEIRVSFSNDNLRNLFHDVPGTYLVVIEARLLNGAKIRGVKYVQVVRKGGQLSVAPSVSPNPLNPMGTLTFTTTRSGAVRVDLFNIQGRLVHRLMDEPRVEAGTHTATIDGRGARGEQLPSGVYFIRGVTAEGVFEKVITILK